MNCSPQWAREAYQNARQADRAGQRLMAAYYARIALAHGLRGRRADDCRRMLRIVARSSRR